ncbi:MAG: hypothetical protein EOO28_32275 [Comamonadaceae bacterium]|nr:MAG: hypothetical protein EOO28_32275 [Comamonadaceae bacterium]
MKPLTRSKRSTYFMHATSGSRSMAATAACAVMLLLQGCAAQNAGYLAAANAQQQRMEAENAAQPKVDFENLPTYLKLIGQMQQNDMWFASLAHIDALEQKWGVSPESNRLRADALRNSGQPVESAVFYRRLTGTPLESFGHQGLGLLAGARGDFAEAVRSFELARRTRPADPALLSDLGYAQLRSGKLAEARVPLMQAFQLKPDSRQSQVNLALYFEATGDTARAAELMEAQRMPDATRAAIRSAARELNAALPARTADLGVALPAAIAPVASTGADAAQPLALKPSHWSGLSMATVAR